MGNLDVPVRNIRIPSYETLLVTFPGRTSALKQKWVYFVHCRVSGECAA
jgi:hypothetical protein